MIMVDYKYIEGLMVYLYLPERQRELLTGEGIILDYQFDLIRVGDCQVIGVLGNTVEEVLNIIQVPVDRCEIEPMGGGCVFLRVQYKAYRVHPRHNIRDFGLNMSIIPTQIWDGECGEGYTELANMIHQDIFCIIPHTNEFTPKVSTVPQFIVSSYDSLARPMVRARTTYPVVFGKRIGLGNRDGFDPATKGTGRITRNIVDGEGLVFAEINKNRLCILYDVYHHDSYDKDSTGNIIQQFLPVYCKLTDITNLDGIIGRYKQGREEKARVAEIAREEKRKKVHEKNKATFFDKFSKVPEARIKSLHNRMERDEERIRELELRAREAIRISGVSRKDYLMAVTYLKTNPTVPEDEADKVFQLVLNHPLINRWELDDIGRLVIVTNDIWIPHSRSEYYMGQYHIILNLSEVVITFDMEKHPPKKKEVRYIHPHIISRTEPCFGNINTALHKMLVNMELVPCINLLINFLKSQRYTETLQSYWYTRNQLTEDLLPKK